MTDLRSRFQSLDRARPPDLWPEIVARAAGARADTPTMASGTSRMVILLAALLLLGALAAGIVFGMLRTEEASGGGLIAFPLNDEIDGRGDAGIFATRIGGIPRRIIGAQDDGIEEVCPAFSPDGRLLAYGVRMVGQSATGEDNRSWVVIVSLDADGSLTPLHRLPGGEPGGEFAGTPCPKWSPDSSAVAWHDDTQLRIAPLDGAVASLDLTPNSGQSPGPPISWTHDGRAIALASFGQVLIVPVDGGEPRILMTARTDGDLQEDFHSVAASPTGPMLAVAGEWWRAEPGGGRSQASGFMRVLDADGRVVVEETSPLQGLRWHSGAPAWSPDGTRLAWGSNRGLEMLDVEKGTLVALDPGPWPAEGGNRISLASSVRWSPDGTRLLFIGRRVAADQWALVSIAVDGPPDPVVLTDWGFELYAEFGEDLTWQPPPP